MSADGTYLSMRMVAPRLTEICGGGIQRTGERCRAREALVTTSKIASSIQVERVALDRQKSKASEYASGRRRDEPSGGSPLQT